MSSLLQHSGRVERRGVELFFYLVHEEESPYTPGKMRYATCCEPVSQMRCPRCGKDHPHLYRAWRKPAGMFGCWVVFRYNGEENVPDLSTPIAVFKLPRGAERLTIEECAAHWHSD
jgi:hypothetical protein